MQTAFFLSNSAERPQRRKRAPVFRRRARTASTQSRAGVTSRLSPRRSPQQQQQQRPVPSIAAQWLAYCTLNSSSARSAAAGTVFSPGLRAEFPVRGPEQRQQPNAGCPPGPEANPVLERLKQPAARVNASSWVPVNTRDTATHRSASAPRSARRRHDDAAARCGPRARHEIARKRPLAQVDPEGWGVLLPRRR